MSQILDVTGTRRSPSPTQILCEHVVPVAPAVLVVVVSHSPGLPRMNPSMSYVSLSIRADREHDQPQSGPWLDGLSLSGGREPR